ncbi:Hpt domain-containing protein [Butyrivibrio sp. MC2013]|uniref:Hpt domain-containing protein n=1 Tax=Butyrivibrio sp. MC2013 TaxID=1280686 RepID=UPI00041A56D6|nr:Hpt domain-containing protein [Butyrivibrio sp. MC2013]
MNENLKKELIDWGIDWEDAKERLVGNEELLCKLALKFADSPNMENLGKALAEGDTQKAFDECHVLKGNTGNLSMYAIYYDYRELTEILRAGSMDGAMELYNRIVPKYDALMEILKRYRQ